jgi:hypothetical protein
MLTCRYVETGCLLFFLEVSFFEFIQSVVPSKKLWCSLSVACIRSLHTHTHTHTRTHTRLSAKAARHVNSAQLQVKCAAVVSMAVLLIALCRPGCCILNNAIATTVCSLARAHYIVTSRQQGGGGGGGGAPCPELAHALSCVAPQHACEL